jgi:nicotinamidase-related amidase
VRNRVAQARTDGWKVVFTRDTHGEDYLETPEGKKLPVPHCIEGTVGWEICPELDVGDAPVFNKPVFGSVALVEWLQERPVSEVELTGVCTDICVVSNAIMIKNTLPEIAVSVREGCCAGVTPDSHREALNTMKMCQIDIV